MTTTCDTRVRREVVTLRALRSTTRQRLQPRTCTVEMHCSVATSHRRTQPSSPPDTMLVLPLPKANALTAFVCPLNILSGVRVEGSNTRTWPSSPPAANSFPSPRHSAAYLK